MTVLCEPNSGAAAGDFLSLPTCIPTPTYPAGKNKHQLLSLSPSWGKSRSNLIVLTMKLKEMLCATFQFPEVTGCWCKSIKMCIYVCCSQELDLSLTLSVSVSLSFSVCLSVSLCTPFCTLLSHLFQCILQ